MDTNKQQKLALEIANALQDMDSLQSYMMLTQRYQEAFLRKVLTKVLSIPEEKIKKSRGALFTFLVNQHAQNITNNIRD